MLWLQNGAHGVTRPTLKFIRWQIPGGYEHFAKLISVQVIASSEAD